MATLVYTRIGVFDSRRLQFVAFGLKNYLIAWYVSDSKLRVAAYLPQP